MENIILKASVLQNVSTIESLCFPLALPFQGREITKDCTKLVNVMKDKVITQEGICENPVVVSTPYINLTACIEKANDMKIQKLLKGESGVKLPDPSDLFPGMELDDSSVIDVKVGYCSHQLVS